MDAAWEDRQERLRTDEYLRVLEDEFNAAADEIEEQLHDHQRQLDAIETMLEDLEQGREFNANDFRWLFGLYYFGPAHPVFNDLANTSSVDVLEFSSLRFELFKYGRQKEFLENLHFREVNFFQNEMEPYLARRFDYGFRLEEISDGAMIRRISADKSGSHDDQYLKNLLIRRHGMIRGQMRVDEDISGSIKKILADIQSIRHAGIG